MARRKKTQEELRREMVTKYGDRAWDRKGDPEGKHRRDITSMMNPQETTNWLDTTTISGFVDDARQNNPTTILPRPQFSNQERSLNQLSNDARMDEMVTSAKNQYQMSQLRNMTRPQVGPFPAGIGSDTSNVINSRIDAGAGVPIENIVRGKATAESRRPNIPTYEYPEQSLDGGDIGNTIKLLGYLGISTAAAVEIIRNYNRTNTDSDLKKAAKATDAPFEMSKPTTVVTERSKINPRRWTPEAVPLVDSGKMKRRPHREYKDLEGNPITRKEAAELARNWNAAQSEGFLRDKVGKPLKAGVKVAAKVVPDRWKGKKAETAEAKAEAEAKAAVEAEAAVEGEGLVEESKPVESDKAPEVKPAEGGEPVRVEGEGKVEKPLKGQGELFDTGPVVAPEPIYDRSMHPAEAFVKNQVEKHVNREIARYAEEGRTLTEAEIDNLRRSRTQVWDLVEPEMLKKAMEHEVRRIAKTKGWLAATESIYANTLNPRTGQPLTSSQLEGMSEALEKQAIGQEIRQAEQAAKAAKNPPGARRAFANPSAFGFGQGQFLNPKANLQALTKGGVGSTMTKGIGLAMTPEMINQGIDFTKQNLIDPRDAALDEAIRSPGATSYDMASAVPGTIAGVGDFLASLGDFSSPVPSGETGNLPGIGSIGGLEFNPGYLANLYNPTVGATARLSSRLGGPDFGLPHELKGATHPTIFSDMVPNIPGSAQGGSWGGLADQWRGVPEDLGTIGRYAGGRAKETLDGFVDSLIGGRTTFGGGYAPPMAR